MFALVDPMDPLKSGMEIRFAGLPGDRWAGPLLLRAMNGLGFMFFMGNPNRAVFDNVFLASPVRPKLRGKGGEGVRPFQWKGQSAKLNHF